MAGYPKAPLLPSGRGALWRSGWTWQQSLPRIKLSLCKGGFPVAALPSPKGSAQVGGSHGPKQASAQLSGTPQSAWKQRHLHTHASSMRRLLAQEEESACELGMTLPLFPLRCGSLAWCLRASPRWSSWSS